MPDFNQSPIASPMGHGKDYPIEVKTAITSLHEFLHAEIASRGPLAFSEIMNHALYHPTWGYYARGVDCVGKSGDFFTSVSVGPTFGRIMARRFKQQWNELGEPNRWAIHEVGAHDGKLAQDVLDEIMRLSPTAYDALIYQIHEPLPALKRIQSERLAFHQAKLAWPDDSFSSEALPGVIFGNELLDALPFECMEWDDGKWHLCRVASAPSGRLVWQLGEAITPSGKWDFLQKLGSNFPHGYRTEVRFPLDDFFTQLLSRISNGMMIWIDYGFARPEYYHLHRTQGTMRTFRRHVSGENPLDHLGACDITAHVDFTSVAESALRAGCELRDFSSQGAWLTQHGRDWLLEHDGLAAGKWSQQFQTLTHPAQLGSRFHVLECSWNVNSQLQPNPRIYQRLALNACSSESSL